MKTEVYAHNVYVALCEDDCVEGVYIIAGKGWEEDPFEVYLNTEEAKSLLVQLSYQLYEV